MALRKSSNVNRPLPRTFSWSLACSSTSMLRWARSTRPTTSPICRIRPAMRSGSAESRSSRPSPTPTYLMGLPVTPRMDRAAPPRASPSILVRTSPVRSRTSSKPSAIRTASCPVMASATRRISWGFTSALMRRSSSIMGSSIWSRPAVSTIRTWCRSRRAAASASRAVATGSPPAVPGIDRDADLAPQGLKLIHGRRPIEIASGQHGLPALPGQTLGQLCRGGRLP